jgi:GTPase SAR1 family protein
LDEATFLEELELFVKHQKGVKILVISGMPGIGKTSLIKQICHRLKFEIRDGVLWEDMRYLDIAVILRSFIEAYEPDFGGKDDIPNIKSKYEDIYFLSSYFKKLMSNKKALIVLDNVFNENDVEFFIPSSGSSTIIIISQNRYLLPNYQTRRFEISGLDPEKNESLDLINKIRDLKLKEKNPDMIEIISETHRQYKPEDLKEIVSILEHHPQAVSIISNRLVLETGWSTQIILKRMREAEKRPNLIKLENKSTWFSLEISFELLSQDTKLFFANLGIFDGHHFSLEAAANLSETHPDKAHEHIISLFGLSLVDELAAFSGGPTRYQLHRVISDFARGKN